MNLSAGRAVPVQTWQINAAFTCELTAFGHSKTATVTHSAAEDAVPSYLMMAEPFVLLLFRRIQLYSFQIAHNV